MQISLLPHQIIGVAWMYEQETSKRIGHYGGILADEMGLGKTVQMIATMMVNRPVEGKEKGTLIVCPVGLLDQWKSEIETKTTGLCKLYVHHGPNRTKSHRELHKYDVVLTTYSTLAMDLPPTAVLKAKDSPEDELENPHKCGPLLKAKWYRIVLDEAQIIRNRTTRTSSAAARLKSILRWCLTGTPIINSLSDAFSMMRVLRIRPWYEWQHFYQNIVKNEKSNPTLSGKRLQGVFKSCLLRRNKNSMLDGKRLIELPEKKVDTVVLDFCEEERAIYSMVEKKAQAVFNRFLRQGTVLKNYSHVFSLIMRLRQCACHPALIQEEYDEAVIEADDEERKTNEIERAQQLVSSDFVEQMKTRLLHTAQERMRQEQDSLDNQLDDDCPICFENIDDGVVTPCQHAYCRACALKLFDKPNDEHLRMSHDQRPCPSCRAPFLRELLFWRRAFEPTDADLEIHDTDDNIPVKGYQILEDRDDDLPVTKRSRPKSTTLPAWMRESSDSEEDEDEDEDEEEDSLSDFIVER
ncbi:hypothetical protein CALVIDRAFT_24180 [Calocera viscosa TUFC12733]|uniref:RING-type domain-containing protein n=1 Tax=Calocera viscosa (strain TUFC12733) TaxID=1330018 RepID=A0A167P703_CALVF|nr:hypothetical protein CALVIDRAFT_24180 [Calocera viscosa TUFC12733]